MARRNTANGSVGSFIVVHPEPLCGQVLCVMDAFKIMHVQPFVARCSIETFDIGVLGWFSGLDVEQGNSMLVGPRLHCLGDVFRPVVLAK